MLTIGDLEAKRVLITGAAGGIGAALAQAFEAQGARVARHYRRSPAEAGGAERGATRGTASGSALSVAGDLELAGEAARVVNAAAAALGGLDILINNAGAMVARRPILDAEDELLDRVFNLNSRAVLGACQAAVPHMIAGGGGAIINVGSIAALDGGGPGSGLYAASKAFVHTLTRHLARDLAKHRIRVNAVSPGVVQTGFHAQTPPERMAAMQAAIPMGRIGTPEDCVGAFLFLASDALSGYVTGQNLHVNGGQAMP
jgi:3-oxoacyl-[acyl-carrier protein] reductase